MKKLILFLLGFFLLMNVAFSEPTQNPDVRYRLFSTQDIWIYLKLDTMIGRIWLVQFSINDKDYWFETVLNSKDITDVLK